VDTVSNVSTGWDRGKRGGYAGGLDGRLPGWVISKTRNREED
jgi:hypothetical protein